MIRRLMKDIVLWGVPALVLSLTAVACDETPTDGGGNGQGQLSVYLTDAPGDVDSVWVQILDVRLVPQDEEEGTISILDEPTGLINLLQLQDSAMALAEDVSVNAGTYTQLRFLLGGAVLQATGGGVHTFGGAEHPHGMNGTGSLMCPSCGQSGIKVILGGGMTLDEGQDAGILMDFDVSQSFGRRAGRSGMWSMHPVIRATVADPGTIEDGEADSEITGSVALDTDVTIPACGGSERSLEEFVPVATATTLTDDEGEPLTFSGETDGEGEVEIEVLGVDTFTLGFQAETVFEGEKLVWEAGVEPDEVTIDSEGSEVGGVAYTVTSVTCETAD